MTRTRRSPELLGSVAATATPPGPVPLHQALLLQNGLQTAAFEPGLLHPPPRSRLWAPGASWGAGGSQRGARSPASPQRVLQSPGGHGAGYGPELGDAAPAPGLPFLPRPPRGAPASRPAGQPLLRPLPTSPVRQCIGAPLASSSQPAGSERGMGAVETQPLSFKHPCGKTGQRSQGEKSDYRRRHLILGGVGTSFPPAEFRGDRERQ